MKEHYDLKQILFTCLVYLIVLAVIWGANLSSFQSLGLGAVAISAAAVIMSYAAVGYSEHIFGSWGLTGYSLVLLGALFIASVSASYGALSLSPGSVVFFAFGLVPPVSIETRRLFTPKKHVGQEAAA